MSVLLLCFAVEVALQGVQALGPEASIRIEPRVELLERLAVELIDPALPVGARADEARLAQHPQVLRGAGLAQAEPFDELAHRPGPLPQQLEHLPPVGIGQRAPGRRHTVILPNSYMPVK